MQIGHYCIYNGDGVPRTIALWADDSLEALFSGYGLVPECHLPSWDLEEFLWTTRPKDIRSREGKIPNLQAREVRRLKELCPQPWSVLFLSFGR